MGTGQVFASHGRWVRMTSVGHQPVAPPDTAVVALAGVGRRFGSVTALRDLDLVVPARSITVLLGPNGAGKTTATRVITGALEAHAGSVRVFGLDPAVEGEAVRRRCGVVSAKPALYDRLSGHANLAYSAELYGMGRGPEVDERIHAAADRFGIDHALDKQVGGFSTGMKTRLALARSVLHGPDLLLFDEPTSGLDPESSHAVLEMIQGMADDGVTVVMCTHLLLEAEGLAQQVVVMEGGTDLVAGAPAELTRRYWPTPVVRLEATDPAALAMVADLPGVLGVDPVGAGSSELAGMAASNGRGTGPVDVRIDDGERIPDLIAELVGRGVRLKRVEPHVPSLEDLYFAVRQQHADGSPTLADDGGRRLAPERIGRP